MDDREILSARFLDAPRERVFGAPVTVGLRDER
jgi:hypothetical protein